MKFYSHLQAKDAKKIIILANNGTSIYRIAKETGLNKDKIRRNLLIAKITTTKQNLSQPWKGPHIKVKYSFKMWKDQRDMKKIKRRHEYASHCEQIYLPFVNFCRDLFNKKLLNKNVKRSADEYIKEFKKAYPNGDAPSRSWVYYMAKNPNYQFRHEWLPSTKVKKYSVKSDEEQLKPMKYNSIEERPDKEWLRSFAGNFEIDSVLGEITDKQALLTLRDIHTGDMYINIYNRKMAGFRDALEEIIEREGLEINTLTMDNGGENNLLWTIIDKSKLYNCHAYCSGEKGTLENAHRLIRRVIPKGESMDKYTKKDILKLEKFVNNYYSKKFNRL